MHAPSLTPVSGEPALLTGLRSPLCYPHPVDRVSVIETHISWVLLAGPYAYKVKKPVNLGFLDFSTLELRRRYCEEELRLNRRTAPSLYLDVVPIDGGARAPLVGGEGEAIEYAVRMRRFEQRDLLDERARQGLLTAAHIDALSDTVAGFHARAQVAAAKGSAAGSAIGLAIENVQTLLELDASLPRAAIAALGDWTARVHHALGATFERRLADGFVRECHGDLHLGNVVLLDGAPVPFDGIEFSEALRWIDVMSDVAFLAMDLKREGLPNLAARFLDGYLARTGDYDGLAGLRFYMVYRALVRAKICAIRARQAPPEGAQRARALLDAHAYVRLATALSERTAPTLTILHGLSGSGKTTVSQRLVESQGAVRLRSDVERKRMNGVEARASAAAAPGEGLYTPSRRQAVYTHLVKLAERVLAAGYPVVVDAAFLARATRERFRDLARASGAAFRIVACEAPEAVLRERIAARQSAGHDASDAGLAVLEAQLASREALTDEELALATIIDTTREA